MQNYVVNLKCEIPKSFMTIKAAQTLDIDVEKKSEHTLNINADLKTDFNIGLIIGSSGSGKTTLAKKIFGDDFLKDILDMSKPIIEQFPSSMSFDERAEILSGVGLTSVPCWIRPVYTLSNGQKSRAEIALRICQENDVIIIDEWTSVVDRTVAKVMSHCIQKTIRKNKKKIILLSCHYDVVEWLNPDFIIDCNVQEYVERRGMVGSNVRSDQLRFDIKEIDRKSWKNFSKYHYLSDKLPGGKIYTFGLFHGENQIGFQCFAAYIVGDQNTYFSNRTVVHPDYCGFGLGIKLINETSKIMSENGFSIKAKFSSTPVYLSMSKSKLWKLTKKDFSTNDRERRRVKTMMYSFDYVG